jgi:FdhD protein
LANRPKANTKLEPPGEDFELAAGFLFSEGIIQNRDHISSIHYCGIPSANTGLRNVVRVELTADAFVDLKRLDRHFYTTSSCGVCGKTSLEAIETTSDLGPIHDDVVVSPSVIHRLPAELRGGQAIFEQTGGLHASALFDLLGNLVSSREDVGRHNALDKLIGHELLAGNLPLSGSILFVSGRVSFELVQKAVMARIPILAAVGAPSSLGIALAERFNITLLGFVRENRFNIYSASGRVASSPVNVQNNTL